MLSSDRRTFLLTLAALPIAGCGFQPIYLQGSASRSLHGQIRTNLIESRNGFILLERLESRLGEPETNARFEMTVEMSVTQAELILDVKKGIVRYELNGVASITVTDSTSGMVVFTDKLRQTTGYSGTSETAQTNAARQDANERMIVALADQIILRLTSTANSWAK